MNIQLEPITETYMPAESGKYLVRTVSSGRFKTVSYIQVAVQKRFDTQKNKWLYSIDCHNQIPTHISTTPLNLSNEN